MVNWFIRLFLPKILIRLEKDSPIQPVKNVPLNELVDDWKCYEIFLLLPCTSGEKSKVNWQYCPLNWTDYGMV